MFKFRHLNTCIVVIALFAIGCSGDDDDGPAGVQGGPPPAAMVGSWAFQSVTINGAPASLADVMEWNPAAVAARLHVQSNSAFVLEHVDVNGGQLWAESGFVFVNGNEMDINIQFDNDGPADEMIVVTFTLNGDVMTLQEIDQGMTVVFTLTAIPEF